MTRWGPVVALLLCAGWWASAGEKPAPASEREIKALIAQLVSPNPAPKLKQPGFLRPKGFDRVKQQNVHDAWEKLRRLGPKAFPFLIERFGDDRYCLTTVISGSDNQTVGDVCFCILFDQLQPYDFWPKVEGDPRGKPKRPSYPHAFLGSKQAARKWWEKNRHKTLDQMQLAALDWVIAEEAKRRRNFTDRERQHLQRLRKKLVKSGKDMPPPNLGGHFGTPELDPPR